MTVHLIPATQNRGLRDTSIGYTYDFLNRATLKDLPGSEPDVTYGYDLLGRLKFANQTGNNLSFTYDALGRKLTEVGPLGTATSTWYLDGTRQTLALPGGGITETYDRDTTGQLLKIRENGATTGIGVLATYTYDNLQRRTAVTNGNGTTSTYGFDPVSRLASLTQNLTGTLNDLTVTISAYNPSSQIVAQSRSNDLYAWTGHGNGSTDTVTNGLNQLSTVGGVAATHDLRGNLTTDPTSGNAYAYSSENLLTSATVGGNGVTLTYDPLLRLTQVAGTATTRFGYDGTDTLVEADGSGTILRRYAPGDGVDEPVVWYEGSGTATRRWLHADQRGSVVGVSDASGNMFAIDTYDEFGKPGATNQGRYQYTGQKWIGELGLYDYKARMYAPALGRFLQTDPIGYGSGPNLYAYVRGDPVNLSDPLGLSDRSQLNIIPADALSTEILIEAARLSNFPMATNALAGMIGQTAPSIGFEPSSDGNNKPIIVTANFRSLNKAELHFYGRFYDANLLQDVIIFNGLPPWMSESKYNGLTVSRKYIYISSNLYSKNMLSNAFSASVLGHELYHATVQYANGVTIWDFMAASAECGCTGMGSTLERPAYIMESKILQLYNNGVR